MAHHNKRAIVLTGRWDGEAKCKGEDPNIFFPTIKPGPLSGEMKSRQLATARLYCDICPVRTICFETAMINKEEGIWGGISLAGYMSSQERDRKWLEFNQREKELTHV